VDQLTRNYFTDKIKFNKYWSFIDDGTFLDDDYIDYWRGVAADKMRQGKQRLVDFELFHYDNIPFLVNCFLSPSNQIKLN